MTSLNSFSVFLLFLLAFPLLWMGISKFISQFGWKHFVNDRMMRTDPPQDAEHYAMQSLNFGGFGNYRNCMNAWVHHSGLFLRPMWMFQFGHPMIRLNWNDITSIDQTTFMLAKCYEISFWKDLPKIRLYGKLGEAAMRAWENNSHQSHHANKR